ncbi:MAG: hypothetical protein ACO2ZD_01415 [Pseudomonadales bacterium]|jgi:hypothetical protein
MSKSQKKGKNLVRDSFTMPTDEHQLIDQLKKRIRLLGSDVKKSELIRAGITLLNTLPNTALISAINAIPNLKTGRPAKESQPVPKPSTAVKAAPKPTVKKPAESVGQAPAKVPAKAPVKAVRKTTPKPARKRPTKVPGAL